MDKKWNLQDIKPAQPRKPRVAKKASTSNSASTAAFDSGSASLPVFSGRKKKRSSKTVAVVFLALIVVAGFFSSVIMSGAEVSVFPRNREPNINATFEASRSPQVGELSYEIMSLEANGERQVSATGQNEVIEQATGSLTIFKSTAGSERLIKNTRFQTSDGKVYRITESTVVPGAKENANGELIPGSIEASAFADEVGDEYNVAANTRFSVPGFKEGGYDSLYNAMYAVNNDPFEGGFDGMKFTIDDTELQTATEALRKELREALLSRVPQDRPAGFVLFDGSVTFEYETLPPVEHGENLVIIKEKAVLHVPLFKEELLAQYLAAATIPGYEGVPVRVSSYDVFAFRYSEKEDATVDVATDEAILFSLIGKPQIIWEYDEQRLKTDLVNASKTALPTILGAYPAIEKAEAIIRPFWKRSFPGDSQDIEIAEIVTPKS